MKTKLSIAFSALLLSAFCFSSFAGRSFIASHVSTADGLEDTPSKSGQLNVSKYIVNGDTISGDFLTYSYSAEDSIVLSQSRDRISLYRKAKLTIYNRKTKETVSTEAEKIVFYLRDKEQR